MVGQAMAFSLVLYTDLREEKRQQNDPEIFGNTEEPEWNNVKAEQVEKPKMRPQEQGVLSVHREPRCSQQFAPEAEGTCEV